MIAFAVLTAAGVLSLAIGILVDPAQAYFSYLTAYASGIGIALGALMLVMIEQLIAATWFVIVRRTAETIASSLPVFVPLFLPIALGAHYLYPWTHVESLDEHARGLVELKTGYLNLPFFLIRSAIYLACWIVFAERLRQLSLRQDVEPGERWNEAMRTWSAPGLVVVGFTLAFAAIDWLMSLEPTWFSTIFGVQLFAGAMLATLALVAVMLAAERKPPLKDAPTPEHCSAVGKMLLTFAIFWAYTTFAQLLIVWIADIPDEVTWYLPRTRGAWLVVGLVVAVAEFVIPFAIMLSYRWKRRARVLFALGVWLLAGHYLEIYWIVMPQLHPSAPHPHWLDAGAAATVAGAACALAAWRARGHAALPIGDPGLDSSLRYSES